MTIYSLLTFFILLLKVNSLSAENTELSLDNAKSVTFILGDYLQGCQKCFTLGVSLWFQTEQIMNFILNESPKKMGSIDTK
jgi:hypothetical protein